MTKFELKDNDCALIFKESNDMEIVLPKTENNEVPVGDNMLIAVAIASLIPTPEFKELLAKATDKIINKIDEEEIK